jgi:hypothetical protein
MYFGSFDQAMADEFIEHHLLNPEEFWTPMPLPSIAANDPYFRDIPGNNWSGQPQGLTFQRSISALENYGHFAELTLIGKTLLEVVSDSMKIAASSAGIRLITDLQGQLIEFVGITCVKETIKAEFNGKPYDLTVNPNTRYRLNDHGEFIRYKSVPFISKWQTVHL